MIHKKLLSLLVLLMTAASGAWAQDVLATSYSSDATLSNVTVSASMEVTIASGATVTINNGLTITSGATLTVTGGGSLAVNGATGANGDGDDDGKGGSTAIGGSGQLAIANATITATGGAGGNGGSDEYTSGFGGDGAPAVSGVSISIQTGSLTAIGGAGGIGGTSTVYHEKSPDGTTANAFNSFPNISDATLSYSTDNVTYTEYESGNTTLYRYMKIEPPAAPDVEVTTNKAEGETTFTEATFAMPAFDATAEYELVRDMAVQMTTTVGDGAEGADYRIRLKKKDDKWEPADLTVAQVMGKFKVHDALENKDLTFYGEGAVCAISIYAVDDQDQPTGNAIAFADLVPGRYVAIATAADGTAYDGQTPQSNVLVLFQGYEVKVPAREFVTYYKDEPLYADPVSSADAVLYTVSSVSTTDGTATLSDAIETAPSSTPLLVFNNSDQDKTFLLIPADAEPNLALTVAREFTGTLEATTIPASTDGLNNYAFNGKKFIWVMEPLAVAANKAWLSVSATSGARVINLVFDDATRIDGVARTAEQSGDYYDLNGRKLAAKPTRKGIYIQNGKKVVVK